MKPTLIAKLIILLALAGTKAAEPVTTKPAGDYHVGQLQFTAPGKEVVELFVHFRAGQARAGHLLVNDKFYSPRGQLAHGDAPNVELCDVTTLKMDGETLGGDFQWVTPKGTIENIAVTGAVRDGIVTGKAGDSPLTGWVRTREQMAKVNGFAPGQDWPAWTGPRGDWSGTDSGHKLATDFSRSRMVWFSEVDFGGGRETRQCVLRGLSGSWTPVLGDGRLFFIHQRPSGEVVDETALAVRAKQMDTLLAKPNVLLDPAVRRRKEQGVRDFALVDADDVVVAVDAASGATLWETVLPGRSFNPAPYNKHADQNRTGCFGDGKVFMLGRTFRLYALDAKTGALLWEAALPKIHESYEAKKVQALTAKKQMDAGDGPLKGAGYPPLRFAKGVVFMETLSGEVAGFDAATGKLLWTVKGKTPAIGLDDTVLVAVPQRDLKWEVASVELLTGKVRWSAPVDGSPEGPPRHLRVAGSYLLSTVIGRTPPYQSIGYKIEPTGLKELWRQADEQRLLHNDNPVTFHNGRLYTRLNDSAGRKSTLVALEPATGKIAAEADATGGSNRNGPIIVNDGLVIVQLDGSHPSGGNVIAMHQLPGLERLGLFPQTHNTTGGYDTPMAFLYVDGRLIIRGCNRIVCYDLRAAR
jgi:outer membrane protein assembly factor BamB